MFRNEHRWNLIFSLAWHVIKSLLHKEEFSLIFLAKKLICIGEKSVPQTVCLLLEVNKYTAELSFGSSRNTLSRSAQISTEICIKLFTRRRIKRRDRWHSICPNSVEFPKYAGHITDYSKAESTLRPQRCVTPPAQFVIVSLCCVSLGHDINLLRRSFS